MRVSICSILHALYPTNTRIMLKDKVRRERASLYNRGMLSRQCKINVTTIRSCPCPGRRMTSQYGLQGLSVLDSQHWRV
jgi:hypothetical protein